MINSDESLAVTLEQLERVSKILSAVPKEHPNVHPSWRAVLMEGWIDQARDLLQEIDECVHEVGDDGGWVSAADAETVECEGVLRAIDLDLGTLTVRASGDARAAHGQFNEELRDTLKTALDRRVRLTARRAVYPRVLQVELIGEETSRSSPVAGEATPV